MAEHPAVPPNVSVVEELGNRHCQSEGYSGSRSGTLYAHVTDALKVTMAYISDLSGNMRDTWTGHLIRCPTEDDSSQFQSTGDVIQHDKRGGLLCRYRWRSDLITMPLA